VTRYWPWTDLDIDPVNDERAVKRAYSAKLKALDSERDPAGFIALRSAYEYARSLAQHGNAEYDPDEGDWDDDDEGYVLDAPAFEPAQIADAEPQAATDHQHVPAAEISENMSGTQDAMAKLAALHSGRGKRRTDEMAVKAAFDALMDSADFENILISNQIEHDLAVMIDNAGTRAFFLAELADFRFGWTGVEARFGLEWPIGAAQQIAESSRFFRHIEQRKPRNERERLYAEALGWVEQGPAHLWSDIGRRKRVLDFLEALQTKAPAAYHTIDERKIAAWEQRGGAIGVIGWPIANFMLFSGIIMAAWLGERTNSGTMAATGGAPWAVPAIWVICGALLLCAMLYRRTRLAAVPDFGDPAPVPGSEWKAFGVILLLIPASLLGPPHIWMLVPIAVVGSGALAFTTHPGLRQSDNFWDMLAQRRYVFAAFWIAAQAAFAGSAGHYLFLPTAIAAWALTHAHPQIQASIDTLAETGSRLRRWHLHSTVLAITVTLVVLIVAPVSGNAKAADYLLDGITVTPPVRAAAIMLLLAHDALTRRHIMIPGMQFYLLRVVAAFLLFVSPTFVMLLLIAARTMGILYAAYRDARAAKQSGHAWRDYGDGYAGPEGGGFSWSWIGGAILVFTILRIFLQAV
jgi:hypothetical protein